MSTIIVASAFTINSGNDPATGLTLADIDLYLYAINKTTGARTEIWDGTQHPTAEVANVGSYIRLYTAADMDAYDYIAGAKYNGADALDADWVIGYASEDHAGVWEYATRTLTMSGVSVVSAVEGDNIAILRGDTMEVAITGLGDLTGYVTIDFTVKHNKADADTDAIIRIRNNATGIDDGLMRINGAAAANAALGFITIDDLANGDITITLDESMTDDLKAPRVHHYDIQRIDASDVLTLLIGNFEIAADVTRLIT